MSEQRVDPFLTGHDQCGSSGGKEWRSAAMVRERAGTDLVSLSERVASAGMRAASALTQALAENAKLLDRTQAEIEALTDHARWACAADGASHEARSGTGPVWRHSSYWSGVIDGVLSHVRAANESAAACFGHLLNVATAMAPDQEVPTHTEQDDLYPCRDSNGAIYSEHNFGFGKYECTRCEFTHAMCTGTRLVHPYDDSYVESEDCEAEAEWMGVPRPGSEAAPYCGECIDQAAGRLRPIARARRRR